MSLLVDLRKVGFCVSERWLVRDIDLSVRSGEIITLIGPNGSGKSTIAKLSLGLLDASAGECYRAKDIRLSYMPQSLSLDWTLPLSVFRLMRLTSTISRKDVADFLSRTGVEHLIDSSVYSLSGGELQRVLLARALSCKPDFLVLDEPVLGVDINSESSMYELIASIRDELGCGILLISHDLHVVMAKSDKVICVNGHICCSGTPANVVKDPEYLTLFNRSASMALYSHDSTHDHSHSKKGGKNV